MAEVLIAPTTAAAESEPFQLGRAAPFAPSTILATGLAGAEEVEVQFSPDNGDTWLDAMEDSTQIVLDANTNHIGVYSPIMIKVTKGITAGAVGVYLSSENNV